MELPLARPRGPLRFSLAQLVGAALACTLLGVGLASAYARWSARPSAVDVGFTQDMIDHHDQAVAMSLVALAKPDLDDTVRDFATEVILFQRWELGILDSHLADWGRERGDLDREAMVWMGMSSTVEAMPGMQPEASMDALRQATGRDADRLFLTMMREHHLGGVHMADYAVTHGSDADLRELAERMSRYQQVEANEYAALLARLGPA